MESLWKKEDAPDNAMYLDLFVNLANDYPEHYLFDLTSTMAKTFERTSTKNNSYADHRRNAGNEKFSEEKWQEALSLYNESLCFAEHNREHLALAYGNRSACHFQLKMYKQCLIDIELAFSSNCPERLKSKLEKRKSDCVTLMPTSKDVIETADVTLSYEADKNFPFMANILEIQRNDEFGRHMIAKCDIPAGKTVMIEDNFVSYTRANNYLTKNKPPSMKCVTCNKVATNPIPCVKCTTVMFCSVECMDGNKVHQMDCGAVYHLDDIINDKYIIQSLLTVINRFESVESLMDFVEETLTSDQFEMPKSAIDWQENYRMFLKLWMPSKRDDFVTETYKHYKTIMAFDKVGQLFNSTAKHRFLMHLVGHHSIILIFNSTEGQISVFTSLLSHSCVPNIQEIWIDNRTACITIRPIKKGEQLFLVYITEKEMKMQRKDHKTELYLKYGFQCKCVKCRDQLADLKKIERNIYFLQINEITLDVKDKLLLTDFIHKCVKVLNKYAHMPWSRQLDYVSKRLGYALVMFYSS